MKTLWLAAVIAASGAVQAAAADLTPRVWTKAPATTDPAYGWGGWYVGGNVGGGWGSSTTSNAFVNGAPPIANQQALTAASPRLAPDGFTAGGQVGYNQQVDRWLFGVEVDANYVDLKQSRTVTAPFPSGGTFTTTNSINTDWTVSVRPRVGYIMGSSLVYATGGLALTDMNFGASYNDSAAQAEAAGFTKTKLGWTAGAGIEHLLTPNWSAKVEYLYSDFGKQSVAGPVVAGPATATGIIGHDIDLKTNTVRGGLNYHFGGPAVRD